MVSKLVDEEKSVSENRHFKSFQTLPVPPRTEMRQKDATDFTSATVKKESEWQIEEFSAIHEYKVHKHQHSCLEDTRLQDLVRSFEEKEKELVKGKKEILEERGLVMKQDKILQDMQIKISHLEKQLKHPELIGLKISKQLRNQIEALGAGSSQQRENFDNCPSSQDEKIVTVKPIQKSKSGHLKELCFYLGKTVELLGRLLLQAGCLTVTLVVFCNLFRNPVWVCWLLNRIFHEPYRVCMWPH